MGYATTRSAERVAAAMGGLASAPIQFETACDVPKGGVLLALPALLAVGLLRHTAVLYQMPKGRSACGSLVPRVCGEAEHSEKNLLDYEFQCPEAANSR